MSAIPRELRDRKQWVIWRYETRDGKRTKCPYQATNPRVRASSTAPATWGSYDQASAAADNADGIGYVFSADDPFAGIDLDGCVNPETGELHPVAGEIIAELDSYRELSPSGTGMHTIVAACLPGGKGRETQQTPWCHEDRHELAVYDRARFFTITGGEGEITERQEQLQRLLARLFAGANGAGSGKASRSAQQLIDEFPKLGQIAQHEGSPPKDSTASGWDHYLACEGIRCDLTDTELATMIAYARRGDPKANRSSYISDTIAAARKASTSEESKSDPGTEISKRWNIGSDPLVGGEMIGDIASGAAVVILHRRSGARLRLPCLGDLFDPRAHTRIVSMVARARFAPLTNADAVLIAQLIIELCGGEDDDPLAEAQQWITDFMTAVGTITSADMTADRWNSAVHREDAQSALVGGRDAAAKTAAMRDRNGELWLPAGPLREHSDSRLPWAKFASRLREIGWRREEVDMWQSGVDRAQARRIHTVFFVGRDEEE